MEDLKVKVSNEKESKEVQELFFELGYSFRGSENKNIEIFKHIGIFYLYAYSDGDLTFSNESDLLLSMKDHKEITISQLRDMVVLKRKAKDEDFLNIPNIDVEVSDISFSNPIVEPHTKVDHSELFDKIRSGEVDLKIENPSVENTLQERAKTYGSFEDVALTYHHNHVAS